MRARTSASSGISQFFLDALAALAHRVMLLEGWQRNGVAFLSGASGALALAPIGFLPALITAFAPLVWLMDGVAHGENRASAANLRAAALIGWWFGFGYFVAGLWWLGAAFIIGGEQFVWLLPLGVVGLPAGLAIFMALGAVIARLLWSGSALRIFALAAGLGTAEWLRANILTGFPWNGFGQAIGDHIVLAQIVSVVGTEALGVIFVPLFASFALLATGIGRSGRFVLPGLSCLIFVGLFAFGTARLAAVGGSRIDMSSLAVAPGVKLRIMQPNIAQQEKNNPAGGTDMLERYFRLSDRASGPERTGVADVTHLFWPEAPLPFIMAREPGALESIRGFLGETTTLVTGGIRAEASEDLIRRYRYFNAIEVYDRSGLQGVYDKTHLVPFGEYLPFEGVLRRIGLEQFVRVIGGFSASPQRRALAIQGLPPVIPMICFETIFSGELEAAGIGAKLLVNITNDAWFGRTSGPYQHLTQARLRAIEFGQPMIRAANSGISAVFDPYGRTVAALPLDSEGILDSPLPVGLTMTLYRQWISFSYGAVMICMSIISVLGMLGGRPRVPNTRF